jgi:Outer membrane protein beta-barrel domain
MRMLSYRSAVYLVAVFLYSTGVQAQLSVKGGINLASMAESALATTLGDIEKQSVIGLQGGLAFELDLPGLLSIQPEVLYMQKGGKSSFSINKDNRVETRLYYNYVEVPVLAKIKFSIGDDGPGIYLLVGPYAGLAISGKAKVTTTLFGNTSSTEESFEFANDDPDERQRRLDYGLYGGLGVKIGSIYAEARYGLGLNNLLDNDAVNQSGDPLFRRNRGIGLLVGYSF